MKIITTKEFGESIRNKRKLLGYTQAYVVSVSGLSVMFISDLERGKKDNMGFDMYLYRLSKHFFDYPEAQYPEIMCKESRLCIPGI